MRLASVWHQGQPRLAGALDETWYDLTRAFQLWRLLTGGPEMPPVTDLPSFLAATPDPLETVAALRALLQTPGLAERLRLTGPVTLRAPVPRPGLFLGVGHNFPRSPAQPRPPVPGLFLKTSRAVIGPEEPIPLYPETTYAIPEVELAVVIGRRARHLRESTALAVVAGYTIVNDVSFYRARGTGGEEIAIPAAIAKGADGHGPMGPWVVTPDALGDPHRLELRLDRNGQPCQRDTTARLLFSIPEILTYVSRYITLEPGDVITTGTPLEGIPVLQPGDVITASIERIGVLRNPVVLVTESGAGDGR